MPDFSDLKCIKFNFGWGAHSAPPGPLAGFGEKGNEKGKGSGEGKERG